MKAHIATILIFISLSSFGQTVIYADSSAKTIDSLFKELSELASIVRKHDLETAGPTTYYKTEIKAYGSDSLTIHFSDASGRLLFSKINRFNKNGCRSWEVNEIYKTSGRLSYREGWKWTCLDPGQIPDPDVKYFDATLYEKERFTYDSLGRVQSRSWWYAPIRGVRVYTYNLIGSAKEAYQLIKKDEESFWD